MSRKVIRNLGFTIVLYLGVYTYVGLVIYIFAWALTTSEVIPQVYNPFLLAFFAVVLCAVLWMLVVVLFAIPQIRRELRQDSSRNPWKNPEFRQALWRTNIFYAVGRRVLRACR